MARNMYGATSADFTLTSGGRVVPGATLTIWSARTGGTQITDLLDVDSVACTTVTSAADGSVVYYGPDGDNELHWADSGQGSRVAIRPTVTDIMDHSIQDEDIAVGADIDPSKIAGTALTGVTVTPTVYSQVPTDGTDQTTALQAEIDALAAAGGGTLVLRGLVRCDGQLTIPTTTVSTQIQQAPIRITGTSTQNQIGTTFNGLGTWTDRPGLDLRYAGRTDTGCGTTLGSAVVTNASAATGDRGKLVTGDGVPDQAWIIAVDPGVSWTLARAARATGTASLTSFGGRIQTLGYGTLELDHLQFVSGADTGAPFVLSTATTIKAHDNIFVGYTSKGVGTYNEDPFVLGGPGQGTVLTSGLTSGGTYTSLTVAPLPVAVKTARRIVIAPGTPSEQAVTTSAAAAVGDTSISVASFTAGADFAAKTGVAFGGSQEQLSVQSWAVPSAPFQGYGTNIRDNHFYRCRRISAGLYASDVIIENNAWMHNCGSNLATTPSTLTTALTKGATYTSLAVSALSASVIAGDVIQVGVGETSQETVASAPASAGATSVSVASFTANADYATGVKVFNTARIGAAVESWADYDEVNTLTVVNNRIGMSGGYNFAARFAGFSSQSQVRGNSLQDVHANLLGLARFERRAWFNLVETGLVAASGIAYVDDWSWSTHQQEQTLISPKQSVQSRFNQGIAAKADNSQLNGSHGLKTVDSTGRWWQWEHAGDYVAELKASGQYGTQTVFRVKLWTSAARGELNMPARADQDSYLRNEQGHLYIRPRVGYRIYLGDDTNGLDTYILNGQVVTVRMLAIGTAPTIAAAGSSTSVSLAGKDAAHTVSLTTDAALSAGTAAATVTFNIAFNARNPNTTPRICLTPKNVATALALPMISASSATAYSIAFGNPPASATAMSLDVLVTGS